MNISIVTLGTRGDVQPYIALAKALQSRGHRVLIAAPENFSIWVQGHGLPFQSLGVDMEALLQSSEIRSVLAGNWLKIASIWRERVLPLVRSSLEATAHATRDAEIIVFHPKAIGVPDVAEATGATAICAAPLPMVPTGDFPLWLLHGNYGRLLNRLSWQTLRVARALYAQLLNDWRRQMLGLGKGRLCAPVGELRDGTATHVCAVSPSVLPKPADWGDNTHMVGYWFLDEGAYMAPDPALLTFLEAGEAPIYFGLGSMTTNAPERLANEFIAAIRQAGCRAVVARGWGGLQGSEAYDDVYTIASAPHDWLFPRVRAVIHHGGAGTTAAGLRAGKPTMIFPQIADQSFWGRRIEQLGCGPAPLRHNELHRESLAACIRDLFQRVTYRERARAMASSIAREDGIGAAIRLIEESQLRRTSR